MSSQVEWISSEEFTRRLQLYGGDVANYLCRGLPHRAEDGLIAWPDGLHWVDLAGVQLDSHYLMMTRPSRLPAAREWWARRCRGVDAASIADRQYRQRRIDEAQQTTGFKASPLTEQTDEFDRQLRLKAERERDERLRQDRLAKEDTSNE